MPHEGLPGDDPYSVDHEDVEPGNLTDVERDLFSDLELNVVDAPEWRELVRDPGFMRRRVALALSGVLHDLARRPGPQTFPREHYDLVSLALAALDAVVSRQGLEEEATTEEVIKFLTGLAAQCAPGRSREEHLLVARYIWRGLLNDDAGGADFSVECADFRDGHLPLRVRFHLVREEPHRSGRPVVRASSEAINVLLSGLDLSVEDAQAAMDTVLRRQIDHGQWGRAEQSAAQSLRLSVAYAERVRGILTATERDVTSVDWGRRAPELLREAREHLAERLAAEGDLVDRLQQAHAGFGDLEVRRACGRVLDLLQRAYTRHAELHGQVMRAEPVFLDAQAVQRFRPAPELHTVALKDDVFVPLLDLGWEEALEVAEAFAEAVCGPVVGALPVLAELYPMLLTPPREITAAFPDEEVVVVEDAFEAAPAFDQAAWEQVDALLRRTVAGPVRLSRLLAEAEKSGQDAADLLALSVLRAFAASPDDGEADLLDENPQVRVRQLLNGRAVVLDDGAALVSTYHSGNDLLCVPLPAESHMTVGEAA
ncbi:hypothetical protein V1460_29985 [Streptomyces sp. SCSIO 30461]|uniref:hypothetical protein n=1 Tax=Streptomyces sp. SCSIO 30461 TaxID=3118085 RepID=UPI0030D54563